MMTKDALAEEYFFFRRWGMTDQQIAERLGIKLDSLMNSLRRQGKSPAAPQEDWRAVLVLEHLIQSGEEFTIDHLPDQGQGAQRLMNRAITTGRIVRIGTRAGLMKSNRIGIYRRAQ